MRKPKPNLFKHLENARQQQRALMARFAQVQARVTQVEGRLQTLHQAQAMNKQSGTALSPDGFLPVDGDLELETSFVGQQAEDDQETERLISLNSAKLAPEASQEQQTSSQLLAAPSSQSETIQEPADLEQA